MTTAVLLCKVLRNESVQPGTGVAVPLNIPFGQCFPRGAKRPAFEVFFWPVRFSKDDATCAKKNTCLDAMIGGHSKFPLVGILCGALVLFWQKEVTNAVLQCADLRNEPVQLSFARLWRCLGVAKFPSFLAVFLSNLPKKCFRS